MTYSLLRITFIALTMLIGISPFAANADEEGTIVLKTPVILLRMSSSAADAFGQPVNLIGSGGGTVSGEVYRHRVMVVGQTVPSRRAVGGQFSSRFNGGYLLSTVVNNAPELTIQEGFHLTDIQEDATDNAGTTIADILASIGQTAITDIDRDAQQGIALTGVTGIRGHWQYTLDSLTWLDLIDVSDENSLLLAADETTRIRFVPDADYNGSDAGELTFRAWDQRFEPNGTSDVDTSNSSGTTAFSVDRGVIIVTILAVNDTPTTTGIGDIHVDEDAGNTTIDPATAFTDIEDADLTYSMPINTNETLFSSATIVSGVLTLDYAPNANGTSIITIRGTDSDDLYTDTTFTVTVSPVADAPILTSAIDNRTGTQDTPFTLNISGHFSDPDGDVLILSAVGLPTSLSLDNQTGIISGTPTNSDALASPFSVTITATDPTPQSATGAFVLTIANINDAPVAQADSYNTAEDTLLTIEAPGVLTNDSDPDNNSLVSILEISAGNGALTFRPDGSFTYLPNPDFNGTDTFTYHANDGTADSGAVTVTLTVDSVNDPPVADAGTDQNVDEGELTTLDGSQSSDPDDGIASYKWLQTSGSKVTLSDDTAIRPTFIAPDVAPGGGSLFFQLTITDNSGSTSTATSTVAVSALDEQPFLMIDIDPVPAFAMPGHAYILPLFAASEEPACGDLAFAFVAGSNPPESMTISAEGCLVEIRWVPDTADAESILTNIRVVASNASQSSDPISFTIEVLEPLVIAPNQATLFRTNKTRDDGSPPVVVDDHRDFVISGGRPHDLPRYYEYELIGSESNDTISGTIPDDGSGLFHFPLSTENRAEGTYRLKVIDEQGFSVLSGSMDINVVTVELVTPVISTGLDGSKTIEITDDDSPLKGMQIAIPAGASETELDLEIGIVDNAPDVSPDAPVGIVIYITPQSDADINLQEPIEITLPYSGIDGIDDSADLKIYTFNTARILWTPIPVEGYVIDLVAQTITFKIDHFSLFTIAQPEQLSTVVTGGINRDDFRMISFPANPDDPDLTANLSEILGEYDDTVWRSAAYNYRTGEYEEVDADGFAGNHPLAPGKTYWIISRENATLTIEGMSLNKAVPYETVLHPGWNMISTPFKEAITLGNLSVSEDGATYEPVTSSGIVDNFVYEFDPHDDGDGNTIWYTKITGSTESLEPFAGYWLFSHSASNIVVRYKTGMATAKLFNTPSLYKKVTWFARRSLHRMADAIASVTFAAGKRAHDPPPPPAGNTDASGSNGNTIGIVRVDSEGGGGCFIDTMKGDGFKALILLFLSVSLIGIAAHRA